MTANVIAVITFAPIAKVKTLDTISMTFFKRGKSEKRVHCLHVY